MAARPYRPARELGDAIERGELDFALALAKDVARERNRPLDLDVALELLPLVADKQSADYDAWALRWLRRWISESANPTIEQAAELIGTVEALSGRSTVAFLSANHVDPDIAVESFVLAPQVLHRAGGDEPEV